MSLEKDLKIIKNAELDIELLNRENDKLCAENNEEIANLKVKIKDVEFIVEEELKASGEKLLKIPSKNQLEYSIFIQMLNPYIVETKN